MEDYLTWIGRTEEISDRLSASPAQRLAATLNQPSAFVEGAALPPAWHWLYFLPVVTLENTGEDGHAQRGDFMPPVTLPRRMWAGSRIVFQQPLHIGEHAVKKSRIADVTSKQGKSGDLVFVKVAHEIIGENGLALLEEQDIVFRDAPTGAAPAAQPAPSEAQWSQTITPDPVVLFRYSALTFNSHRIHYDIDYCREVEGYAGLVVHGPLTATLLLESLRAQVPQRVIKTFSFRAVSALYAGQPFRVEGRVDENHVQLWTLNPAGGLAMQASATLE